MTDMRTSAADTVWELFEADPRVAVVLAEISVERFAPAFVHDPRRAVNVGIMEQTMVGVAAGFAMEGFHPVMHTIAPFFTVRRSALKMESRVFSSAHASCSCRMTSSM